MAFDSNHGQEMGKICCKGLTTGVDKLVSLFLVLFILSILLHCFVFLPVHATRLATVYTERHAHAKGEPTFPEAHSMIVSSSGVDDR